MRHALQLAAGIVDLALGTDQGGSIRVPSSFCGVVGLKPTHGLVPYSGILSMDASIDHVGPMAKTVRDCALLLQVRITFRSSSSSSSRTNLTHVMFAPPSTLLNVHIGIGAQSGSSAWSNTFITGKPLRSANVVVYGSTCLLHVSHTIGVSI